MISNSQGIIISWKQGHGTILIAIWRKRKKTKTWKERRENLVEARQRLHIAFAVRHPSSYLTKMLLGARFRTGVTTHSVSNFDARFRCATCGARCFHSTTTSVQVQRIVGTHRPTVTLAPTSLCSALLWLKTNKKKTTTKKTPQHFLSGRPVVWKPRVSSMTRRLLCHHDTATSIRY